MMLTIYTKEKVYNFKSTLDKNYEYAIKHVHRKDGPALIWYYKNKNIGLESWYVNGILHRKDGPAIISYNYNKIVYKSYYLNGVLHRKNKPAKINYFKNGNIRYEEYFINGKCHREDGPSYISYCKNRNIKFEEYCLNNIKYSKNKFNQILLKKKLKLL